MTTERRPSDTHPIDRRELLEQLRQDGKVVTCPGCSGDGLVSPRIAERLLRALPVPEDRPTMPDLENP